VIISQINKNSTELNRYRNRLWLRRQDLNAATSRLWAWRATGLLYSAILLI